MSVRMLRRTRAVVAQQSTSERRVTRAMATACASAKASRMPSAGSKLWQACKTKLRGLAKVDWTFTFAAAADDLVRVPKLIGPWDEPSYTRLLSGLCRTLADCR